MKIDLLIDLKKLAPETLLIGGMTLGLFLGLLVGFFICCLITAGKTRRQIDRIYRNVENLYGSGKATDTRA